MTTVIAVVERTVSERDDNCHRLRQSTVPLDTVQRFFTTSLTQAAADPVAPAP